VLATREGCDKRERKRNVSHKTVPRGERKMAERAGEIREEDGADNARGEGHPKNRLRADPVAWHETRRASERHGPT
jgi:hypothetical protein